MRRLFFAALLLTAACKKHEEHVAAPETPVETAVPAELKPSYLRMPVPADCAAIESGTQTGAVRAHLEALGVPTKAIVRAADLPGLAKAESRVFVYAHHAQPGLLEAVASLPGRKVVLLETPPAGPVPTGVTVWSGDIAAFLKGLNGAAPAGPEGFTVGVVAKHAGGSLQGDGSLKLR